MFRKQYYLRVLVDKEPPELYLLTDESFMVDSQPQGTTTLTDDGWTFDVGGTGFKGTFQVELDVVPEEGQPAPIRAQRPGTDR